MICYENIEVNKEITTIVDVFKSMSESIDTYSFKLYKKDRYIGYRVVKSYSLDDALENLRFDLKYEQDEVE